LTTNKENQWQLEPLQVILRLFQFTCGHIKLKKKEINEEVANKIKKLKAKEMDKKRSKQVHYTFAQAKQMVQRCIEKENTTTFNHKWSIDAIRVVGGWFHNNFRIGF
jgi:hypothetical protein